MNRRWHNSWPGARSGTTLIEVLAGLVVLATLLTSVAIARGRFLRQWADADRRLAVAHSIDRLLGQWLADSSTDIPAPGQRALEDVRGCYWRTSVIRDLQAAKVGAVIIRIEVFDLNRPGARAVYAIEFLHHVKPRIKRAIPAKSGGKSP